MNTSSLSSIFTLNGKSNSLETNFTAKCEKPPRVVLPSEASLKTFRKLHFTAAPITALRDGMKREQRDRQWAGLYWNYPFRSRQFWHLKKCRLVPLDPLGYPDLDERLPRNPKPIRLPVIGNQSSPWENQHSPFAFLEQSNRLRHIEDLGNLLSFLTLPSEFLPLRRLRRLRPGNAGQRSLPPVPQSGPDPFTQLPG